jgi:hypothetical protein
MLLMLLLMMMALIILELEYDRVTVDDRAVYPEARAHVRVALLLSAFNVTQHDMHLGCQRTCRTHLVQASGGRLPCIRSGATAPRPAVSQGCHNDVLALW